MAVSRKPEYRYYNIHLLGRRLTANLPNRGKQRAPLEKAPCLTWASIVPICGQCSWLCRCISTELGVNPNSDLRSVTMFVDQDGESYTPDGGTTSDYYDVSEGVYVKLKLDGTYTRFENVKKTAKVIQVLKLGLYVDAAIRGYITMKNVPIQWDVEP